MFGVELNGIKGIAAGLYHPRVPAFRPSRIPQAHLEGEWLANGMNREFLLPSPQRKFAIHSDHGDSKMFGVAFASSGI